MESDIIIETPAKNRYSMYDFSSLQRQHPVRREHSFNVSDLPKRSRSVMNLSAPVHTFKKRSWVLPESPTVSETQAQLTKRRTLSGALSPPAHKLPNIERYLEVFTKLKASYGGFLKVLEELNRSELSPKEGVLFEKCLRKLSNKLQKIRDLNELYIHQEHMKEGAKNLLDAMERESSKKIRNRIEDVKSNYKKNLNRLCAIEDEINNLAGGIKIQVIGLIGFARLSPGDIYGVQLKHAYERSSSKCKVVGQGQKWSNSVSSFRISLLHDLQVKVHEIRKMASTNIGVVTCPIGNFISSEPQEFVLPVNSTGTLKLKISAVWSPFSSKEETVFRGKIAVHEFPDSKIDALSDNSLSASPCSTPRSGTLSSMPTISCRNGTLTPVKVSINGDSLASQGSVIRHWKNSDETSQQSTVVETEGSTWIASISSIKSQSMPNIADLSSEETKDRTQSVSHSITPTTESNDESEKSTDIKPATEVKKKPRPVSLSPAFTNAHSIPPVDYEIVDLNGESNGDLKTYSKSIEGLDIKMTKQRPKSLGPSFKMIPSPDYSPPTSPVISAVATIPTIVESDITDTQPDCDLTDAKVTCTAKDNNNTITNETHSVDVTESNAVTTNNNNAAKEASDNNQNDDVPASGDNDDIIVVVRALLLQIAVKIAAFPEDLRIGLKRLQDIINKLSNMLQEQKKESLIRSVSVENALNSIDSAFDFLSEHQTLKRISDSGESHLNIIPQQFRRAKELLGTASTPLKVNTEKYYRDISDQTDIFEILQGFITSPEDICLETVCKTLGNNEALKNIWSESCKENELFCRKEQLLQSLRLVKSQGDCFSEEVCSTVLNQLLSCSRYASGSEIVSVFQMVNFFNSNANGDLVLYFQAVQKELRCLKALKSKDDLLVLSTIQDRKMVPIVASCLEHLALLLTDKNKTIQNAAASFLIKIPNDVKKKATDIYIELLESKEEVCRVGACHALGCLEAISARDQIAYLWKNDEREVRKVAFEALKVVGFPEDLMTPSANRRSGFAEVATRL